MRVNRIAHSVSRPESCLVLMLKSPERSKTRLNAEIGASARTVAEHLCDCALEDMHAWRGPVCFAPAANEDTNWLSRRRRRKALVIEQCTGNLGRRINHVNSELHRLGHGRQIFIGTDCPAIDETYLCEASQTLETHDVVLGPAADGGVVLMGTRGLWPDLERLPWSTAKLGNELVGLCREKDKSVAFLSTLSDVDSLKDLKSLKASLTADPRTARQAFGIWLEQSAGANGWQQ